jgi:hypothetical protein
MWEELQALDGKIDKLRERVRRATEPVHASARELTTIIAQEITCTEDDLSERTAIFYNGSGDTYVLHRLSVVVTYQTPAAAPTQLRQTLDRYAFGYSTSVGIAPGNSFVLFDFVWNYLITSRQSTYSRQPLGSPIFNGLERSQAFDLYEPLVLKPVDAIEFRMRPTAYALPGTPLKTAGSTYFVNFLAFGYRRPL